ncbi:triple tyrosine motif-containing protein [Psychroflexus planctonicus]|uniref:HTH luxR-type domain-containing protein n=1 Tax=Psychroflexus planctonicus TaxID=1526575 RepID=A0ABQ1SJG5_9FLAO|nr:triple tyrosine motif-containing protein [Psychroflexus planctonicus]GGE39475.1 hypothetical protein GCM10010832_19630 [Psychroflexus planctonicus]
MKSNWIFIFFVAICTEVYAQSDSLQLSGIPLRTHFNSEDYQGGIESWDFVQSEKGLLYVANNKGLLEFDGNKWIKYAIPDATKIRTVTIDSKGVIYVGGQNQLGYFIDTGTGLEFQSLRKELKKAKIEISEIWKIFEYEDKIYFNTEDKLIAYSSSGLETIESPGFLINSYIVDGRLICHFYNMGLYEFKKGKYHSLPKTELLPKLAAIHANNKGYYFFTESGDVYEYDETGFELKTNILNPCTINDVKKLKNGDYAVGTQNNGLLILKSDFSLKLHLTNNKGITSRTVKSIYEDNFNNLWVALNNGIDYLKLNLPFRLINEELGVEGTGYDAYYFDGNIHLGTNNGLFIENNTGDFSEDKPFQFIPRSEGQVYTFSEIDNSLILNHHKGAFKIVGKKLKKFHDIGSWTFVETSNPNLILGGDYRGIKYFEKENDSWKNTTDIPGLTESSRILVFENDSVLWMSHGYRGVYRMAFDENMQLKNEIKHFDQRHGFPSNILITSYNIDGKMVFTSEHGMYNFNPTTQAFSSNAFFDEMLGKEHVSDLVSDGENSIYFIQNQKFGVIEEEKFGNFNTNTTVFEHINRYISDDLQHISVIDKNNILITSKEGFVLYNPSQRHSINKDFSTIIRSVKKSKSEDSTYVTTPLRAGNLAIDKNQSIKIEYAAPYYDGFEDLKYSFRLHPLDEKWSKWYSMNEKSYDHLPYGNYTFEVKAINIYGIESQVSSISFQVSTPWYATWMARTGYFMIFLMALVLIPIIQRRRHKVETSFITEQKEKELQVKDEEIDKLYNEKLQTELDLKNDQLTSITMQLIKNKEFIQTVQNKISYTIDKGGSSQELKRIINTIDKELADEDYWDKFAYHFDQVHGNYLEKLSNQNIKLSPREIKLAAFLRMNMSSKEIAKILNITTRGVELARYRLRKKLNLSREQNLVEYLIELDNKKK